MTQPLSDPKREQSRQTTLITLANAADLGAQIVMNVLSSEAEQNKLCGSNNMTLENLRGVTLARIQGHFKIGA